MNKTTKERIADRRQLRRDKQSAWARSSRRERYLRGLCARLAKLRTLGVVLPLLARRVTLDDMKHFEMATTTMRVQPRVMMVW